MDHLTAIILAAGKGTRMNSKDKNKVTLEVGGQPMLLRTIKTLKDAGVEHIVVVVGFAKKSVVKLLGPDTITAEQRLRLGTGHAVKVALKKIPEDCHNVLIVYGDDAFMHTPRTFRELYKTHRENHAKITFITMDIEDPEGFGRIIRDERGEVTGIIEEKNATEEQRNIKEINLGCYIIDKEYLTKNLKHIKKNPVTKEYYITDIIDIIAHNKHKIAGYNLKNVKWRGVNTREDLEIAKSMF